MKIFIPWLLAVISNLSMLFTLRVIGSQRGELVVDEETTGDIADDEGDLDLDENGEIDDDDGVMFGLEEGGEEEGEEEDTGKDKDGDKGEGEKPETVESLTAKFKELETTHTEKLQEITNLNTALHEARQTKKAAKVEDAEDGEVPLTRAQIVGLAKEHADDPETMVNIVDYMVKEAIKKGKDETVDAVEISRVAKDVSTSLNQAYPDLMKDDSEIRVKTNEAKKNLGLDDHHLGDFLAMSALIHYDLDNIRTTAYEEGKKVGLGEKAEVTRKKSIKTNDLADKGKGEKKATVTTLSGRQKTVADEIGLSKSGRATYQKMLGNKKTQEV